MIVGTVGTDAYPGGRHECVEPRPGLMVTADVIDGHIVFACIHCSVVVARWQRDGMWWDWSPSPYLARLRQACADLDN